MKPIIKLYWLVIMMVIFMCLIGWHGVSELNKINQNAQTLYANSVIPIKQLTTTRFSYAVGIVSTAHEIKARQISFNSATDQILKAEISIAINWNAYLLTRLTSKEAQLVKQTSNMISVANLTINRLKETLIKEDSIALDKVIYKELYPAVNPVIIKLNELIALQVKVGENIHLNSNDIYKTVATRFCYLIAFSLLIIIVLSYYIVRNVKELIKNLQVSDSKTTDIAEKYRSLVEHAGDPIFLLNADMSLSEANSSACKLLGYSVNEFSKMKISNIFVPEDLEKRPLQWDLLKKNKALLSERRWIKKDGQIVNVEMNIRLLEGKGYLAIVRDITERKQIEDRLRESERKYRNIFENAQDVFYQTSLDGTILDVSPSIKQHTGYTREELISTSVLPVYFDTLEREKGITLLTEHGVLKDYQVKLISSAGDIIHVLLNARIILDDNGSPSHIDGVLKNITESIVSEQEREKLIADIVHRNKNFEQFAQIVSHDLRAPVASILGIAILLKSDISDKERTQFQDFLFHEVEKLDDIIKVLNEVLQAKTEISERKKVVYFSKIVDNIKSIIPNLVQNGNAEIFTDFSAVESTITLESYLKSIFYNLISNSIKYKQPGKASNIWIKSDIHNKKVRISFRDNARGLDLEKYGKKIFGFYQRFHLNVEGKGLGLFMVKTHVEILGGSIAVKSELGVGTEFIIELPIN